MRPEEWLELVTCQPGELGLCPEGTGRWWRNLSRGVVGSDPWFGINSLCCSVIVGSGAGSPEGGQAVL